MVGTLMMKNAAGGPKQSCDKEYLKRMRKTEERYKKHEKYGKK